MKVASADMGTGFKHSSINYAKVYNVSIHRGIGCKSRKQNIRWRSWKTKMIAHRKASDGLWFRGSIVAQKSRLLRGHGWSW